MSFRFGDMLFNAWYTLLFFLVAGFIFLIFTVVTSEKQVEKIATRTVPQTVKASIKLSMKVVKFDYHVTVEAGNESSVFPGEKVEDAYARIGKEIATELKRQLLETAGQIADKEWAELTRKLLK